jgi:hypothetical protein
MVPSPEISTPVTLSALMKEAVYISSVPSQRDWICG